MILFICNTPFQVMNALNIINDRLQDEKIDMYITDGASQNYDIYGKLKELNIFHKIYFIKFKELQASLGTNKLFNYVRRTISVFQNEKYYKKMCDDFNVISIYDKIYAELPDYKLQIIYTYQSRYNPNVEVLLYEDGVASYSFIDAVRNRSFLKQKLHKLFFGDKLDTGLKGMLLYKPEFINNIGLFPIEKIHAIDKSNTRLKNFYNSIFQFKDDYLLPFHQKKYIYFDQPFGNKEIDLESEGILEIILSHNERDNTIIKLHPRTSEHRYDNQCTISNDPISFEIIELNADIDNMALISVFSTACLNPKIIFDEEPYVILLFKLVDITRLSHVNEQTFDIVYRVRDSYKNPNKFFIPETIQELKQILTSLK
ncbi:hypothetical protein ACIFOT_12365 [Neobacillus sp. NRS-1170]|uniref:hypothetical protein n=1 Tax=Neobacillus sp. NRS-1170 TaxID=3233898 RepID=UPI003D2E0D35